MQKLKRLVAKKSIAGVRKHISSFPYAEAAEQLETLNSNEQAQLLQMLQIKEQSKLFSFLQPEIQANVVKYLSNNQIKILLEAMYTEEAVDFLEDLPASAVSKLLKTIDPDRRKEILKILNYGDDMVGSIMTSDILTLKKSWTIAKAFTEIKEKLNDVHFAQNFYIVDNKNHLMGYIKIKDIIFENRRKTLRSFVRAATSVQTTTDKEDAAQIFAKYNMTSLPVLDYNKELVGIIMSDSVIDILQEEASEDFQVMAGIKAYEKPYSRIRIIRLFKLRVIWLLLLMFSSTLSQIVLDAFLSFANTSFKDEAGHITVVGITSALVAILPVVSGAAGNAGSQSSATIIRALATGDITTRDYFKVFGKELRASTLIGITLGLANFVRLVIYYAITGDIQDSKYIFLSLAASLSLMLIIIFAQVVGSLLPLIAKVFKIDPAVMAAPVLTTLIDTLSIVIFFGISIGIMIMII